MNTTSETEIELKFLFGQVIEPKAVSEFLYLQGLSFKQAGAKLKNNYFDTPGLDLARNDIGLRIRSSEGLCEQTVKTAGRVLSGLHQRPEYNVALVNNEKLPVLSLFPSDIWYALDIAQIQQELTAVFSTDFYRTSWEIMCKEGIVLELVLDAGTIESRGKQEIIAEFELELLSGESALAMAQLFDLANLLVGHFKLRPGVNSKAARGYALWLGKGPDKPETFFRQNLLPLALADRESFYLQLDFALAQLQLGVEYCLSSPGAERVKVFSEPLLFLEQIFREASESFASSRPELAAQFEQVIGLYRALEQQLHRASCGKQTAAGYGRLLQEFCYQGAFNHLQLALLELLIDRECLPDGVKAWRE
ncbi:CYTH domain-containing protein [Thalassomonas haliotis]|uniref:CYTH domain-containing protein n=2 Tax=Thalassomonas haliotis TaxID=485448 RepID=A0ABY7VK14_9GAMM|nr:CYTH domain-containing protein [Thalassomonas haliotis]